MSRTASSFPGPRNERGGACSLMRHGSNPVAAARVLALLNGDGEEARVVGGAVRNALLKIPTGDIDIATTALPDEVVRRAQDSRHQMRADRHRPRHRDPGRRCAAVRGHERCWRQDTETYGRKAKVAFGRDWGPRCRSGATSPSTGFRRRRWPRARHVAASPISKARQVRFIGDAAQRIAEDYLRILSSSACMPLCAGAPDRAGYLACIAGARGALTSLSAERVRMEDAEAAGLRRRRGRGSTRPMRGCWPAAG